MSLPENLPHTPVLDHDFTLPGHGDLISSIPLGTHDNQLHSTFPTDLPNALKEIEKKAYVKFIEKDNTQCDVYGIDFDGDKHNEATVRVYKDKSGKVFYNAMFRAEDHKLDIDLGKYAIRGDVRGPKWGETVNRFTPDIIIDNLYVFDTKGTKDWNDDTKVSNFSRVDMFLDENWEFLNKTANSPQSTTSFLYQGGKDLFPTFLEDSWAGYNR